MKRAAGRAPRAQNQKLSAKYKDIRSGKIFFLKSNGNSPKITDKLIRKIIDGRLDITLRELTEEELVTVLQKKWKLSSTKYFFKYRKQESLTTYFVDFATL